MSNEIYSRAQMASISRAAQGLASGAVGDLNERLGVRILRRVANKRRKQHIDALDENSRLVTSKGGSDGKYSSKYQDALENDPKFEKAVRKTQTDIHRTASKIYRAEKAIAKRIAKRTGQSADNNELFRKAYSGRGKGRYR